MTNRYAAPCVFCRETVPAGEGRCWRFNGRWCVAHEGCKSTKPKTSASRRAWTASYRAIDNGDELGAALHADRARSLESGALTVRNSAGEVVFQRNGNGRCEDAPCCGCCT